MGPPKAVVVVRRAAEMPVRPGARLSNAAARSRPSFTATKACSSGRIESNGTGHSDRDGHDIGFFISLKGDSLVMRRSTARRLLLGVFVFEIAMPVLMFKVSVPPRPYAWSMYTESSTSYRYIGDIRDGKEVPVDSGELGRPWSGIYYGPQALQLICKRHPEFASVVRYYNGEIERSERC